MTLGCFCKFDDKNRIHVPMKIFESAGFQKNGSCFVSHEEGSEEIKLTIKQREPRRNAGYTIVQIVRIGDSEFVAGERGGRLRRDVAVFRYRRVFLGALLRKSRRSSRRSL